MAQTDRGTDETVPPPRTASPADLEAFSAFFNENVSRLHASATYEGATNEEADDLVQDTMEELFHRWSALRRPLAYALTAVRHRTIKHLARERDYLARVLAGGHLPEVDGIEDRALAACEDQQVVEELLSMLEPRRRHVFTLYALGLPYAEIAVKTGMTQVNARQLVHQSRQQLKRYMDPDSKVVTTRLVLTSAQARTEDSR